MNNSESTKKDSTDALQRKLSMKPGQQCNAQVTQESIQERQEVSPVPSLESEPQPEGDMLDNEGSEIGKGRPVVRATTIDQFLKENGIDVALEGLSNGEQINEQHGDGDDSMELNKNYYQFVMADSDDDEDIYGRTIEEWEEVTFDLGGPVGPIAQSVSNLTSFAGTTGRYKRFLSLLYTNWQATKFILPASAEKWVIQTIRDAWKRFKGKLKQNHFEPYEL
ncbi:hypothetical protein PIB30_098101 [Stylosanthes scabra]|uniref:Uncharacterized protein n=1 Tax=Stylosanthes scabra TaxID=79078 RepID=A0ABU6XW38_9FABA|nr:hypothetical protein [Stylosanthes scabra]